MAGRHHQVKRLIWKNNFVAANRWMIPVIVVFFSLLVGLAQKYLHAPNVIREGALEALAAGDYYGYRTFWGALCSSFVSLFSGASIGPEGPLGVLAIDVSEWLAIRLRLARDDMLPAGLAGVSAAYNGIVGSPIFSAVYASEQPTGKLRRHLLAVQPAGWGSRLLALYPAEGATLCRPPRFGGGGRVDAGLDSYGRSALECSGRLSPPILGSPSRFSASSWAASTTG